MDERERFLNLSLPPIMFLERSSTTKDVGARTVIKREWPQ